MNVLKVTLAYFNYYLKAKTAYKVHSPFLYNVISTCFRDTRNYYAFSNIEQIRTRLKKSKQLLSIQDFGAGSRVNKSQQVAVASILKRATSSKSEAQLFYKLVQYFNSKIILELGTNLGITTSYLASVRQTNQVYSFEGDPSLINLAKEHFKTLQLNNITVIEGNFDSTLPDFLNTLVESIDLVFLDGNHRKQPTLDYYQMLKPHLSANAVVVVDDIRWSAEMYDCWETLSKKEDHQFSLDYGSYGILFHQQEKSDGVPTNLTYIDYWYKFWQIGFFS